MQAQRRTQQEAVGELQAVMSQLRQERREPDWARYAEIYDETVGTLRPYRQLIEGVVAMGQLEAGMRVADVACGTGNLMQQIELVHLGAEVYGFDADPVMLELARGKFEDSPFMRVGAADLNRSDWVDVVGSELDVVFSVNTVYILKDAETFFASVRRSLRRGGKFVLSNPVDENLAQVIVAHVMMGGEIADPNTGLLIPKVKEMFEINLDIKAWVEDGFYHFYKREDLIDMLEASHLVIDEPPKSDYAGINDSLVAYAV